MPPDRYSFAERNAARLGLSKSRFFLVLGYGAHMGSDQNPVPATICTCSKPNLVVRIVRLLPDDEAWSCSYNYRFSIELKGRQSPGARLATARRVVSAIGGLFAHVHHTAHGELAPYQIPRDLINGCDVSEAMLEALDYSLTGSSRPAGIRGKLYSGFVIPQASTATIFYLLPFVLQNEDLFNACSFFRSCCSEFSFMDGVVDDVLYEPEREPKDEIERLALENVVLQSSRIVEALVGEPGDAKRFRERLKAWGIDHNERVGFRGRRKQRLEDRIRWLQKARDSAASHGKRRRINPFTLFEAMEAQHLADAILDRALWWMAESQGRPGDESEVAFLLEEMFPSHPGWSKDKTLLRGKRAVDLARIPGGLARIQPLCKRLSRDAHG